MHKNSTSPLTAKKIAAYSESSKNLNSPSVSIPMKNAQRVSANLLINLLDVMLRVPSDLERFDHITMP